MDENTFKALKPGDRVRHHTGGQWYTVMTNFGDHITAVAITDMTNPPEWEKEGDDDLLGRLQLHVNRLEMLLHDPNEGLSTWNTALRHEWAQIAELWKLAK